MAFHFFGAKKSGVPGDGWPWLPLVKLSIWMALVPGFLLGGLMLGGPYLGITTADWYEAATQAHGHAQLLGWGGAMILGVGLHFLPRIRGARWQNMERVGLFFWLFAAGIVVRVIGQPVAAVLHGGAGAGASPAQAFRGAALVWQWVFVIGALIELAGLVGLVILLAGTLRQGPPLEKKKPFAELIPWLALTGGTLLIGMISWAYGAAATLAGGGPAQMGVMEHRFHSLGMDTAVYGFIPAISIAMSSRLFPLFFRLPLGNRRLLRLSGGLVAVGIVGTVAGPLFPSLSDIFTRGIGPLALAFGLTGGSIAVRVFARRQSLPGDRGQYRLWKDPAALTTVAAYVFLLISAVLLAVPALARLGVPGASIPLAPDLIVHTLGAGFMTLLILGVAPVLLPGFAGGKPPPAAYIWVSGGLGVVSVLLRTVPGLMLAFGGGYPPWADQSIAVAGPAGALAVIVMAAGLRHCWMVPRRPG